MLRLKTVAGIGLVALLLNAGLVLVPGGDHFAVAGTSGDRATSDPTRTNDVTPTAGDPDGPTGDVAPPTSGTISEPAPPVRQPVKRLTAWTQVKTAFMLWFRFSFVR
jgi:hypothetical protein